MKRIMAVYDVDPFYADRFAEFANEREMTPFTAVAFASLEKLRDFAGLQPVEVLLVGSDVPEEELSGIKAGQVIRLSEDGRQLRREPGGAGGNRLSEKGNAVIYKYQSSDAVLREVMACYQVGSEQERLSLSGLSSRVIGVYSPVGRCGKTGFSVTLGQILARDKKVLYLNLEEHSGLSVLMGTTYKESLSDLIYYYRQGEYSRVRLGTVLHSLGSLDYVPPAAYAEDLAEIKGEELAGLVAAIAGDGLYDEIVLDIGHLGRGIEPVLELCRTIYVVVKEDCVSAAKVGEWREYLEKSGQDKLWGRVRQLRLPTPKNVKQPDTYFEQLLWGELGYFVQKLLRQQGGGVAS